METPTSSFLAISNTSFVKMFLCTRSICFLHDILRKDTQFLDVAHNSSHEGTNHGMKSCAAAVLLPGHNLATAAKQMAIQAFISTKRLKEMSSKDFQQNRTLVSTSHRTISCHNRRGHSAQLVG
jgi:hypothetical protein